MSSEFISYITEFISYITGHLVLVWGSYQRLFLVPLPIAAIVALFAYFSMRQGNVRSWKDFMEFIFPASLRQARTMKVDVMAFVIVPLLVVPLSKVVVLAISGQLVADLLARLTSSSPTISEPWGVVSIQLAAVLLFTEFGIWLGHYLHHKVPFLWEIHKAHHSSEGLAYISGHRRHPLEPWLTRPPFGVFLPAIPIGIVLYFTGGQMHPYVVSALVVHSSAVSALDLLHHSPIPLSFGRLSRVFNSPAMHQTHHSADPRHRDKNFGSWSAIFDWMFGTLYIPAKEERFQLGASEEEIGQRNPHLTVTGFFLGPVIGAGRQLAALATSALNGRDK